MNKKQNNKKPSRKANWSPEIPLGILSVDDLEALAKQLKAEGAVNVKLGGEISFVWEGTSLPEGIHERIDRKANDFAATSVRPVKLCSAETFCNNFQRPVLNLAKQLHDKFAGAQLPYKFVIGVAGCKRSCSEPATKDIGIIAQPKGFEILVGGTAGLRPMIGRSIGIVPDEEAVIGMVARIVDFFRRNGRKSIRLGSLIEKEGFENFLDAIKED